MTQEAIFFPRLKSTAVIMCFALYFFSISASAQVKYIVQNDTSLRRIVITLDASNVDHGYYFTEIKCGINFFDKSNKKIGKTVFDFDKNEIVSGGETHVKYYALNYRNAFIARGAFLSGKRHELGEKADGPLPPPIAFNESPTENSDFAPSRLRAVTHLPFIIRPKKTD